MQTALNPSFQPFPSLTFHARPSVDQPRSLATRTQGRSFYSVDSPITSFLLYLVRPSPRGVAPTPLSALRGRDSTPALEQGSPPRGSDTKVLLPTSTTLACREGGLKLLKRAAAAGIVARLADSGVALEPGSSHPNADGYTSQIKLFGPLATRSRAFAQKLSDRTTLTTHLRHPTLHPKHGEEWTP